MCLFGSDSGLEMRVRERWMNLDCVCWQEDSHSSDIEQEASILRTDGDCC